MLTNRKDLWYNCEKIVNGRMIRPLQSLPQRQKLNFEQSVKAMSHKAIFISYLDELKLRKTFLVLPKCSFCIHGKCLLTSCLNKFP